jgi:DNA-directed RNA polymerase subunit L
MKSQISLLNMTLALLLTTAVIGCSDHERDKTEEEKIEELRLQVEQSTAQARANLDEAADETAKKAKELCEAAKEKANDKDKKC